MKLLFIQETDWIKRNPLPQHHMAELLALRGHEIRAIDYEFLWRTQGKKELFSKRQVFDNITRVHTGGSVTVIRPGIVKVPAIEYFSLIFTHRAEIQRQIDEFKPDVIVGLGILNAFLAARAARRRGIPFIYYWLDVLHWLIPFKPFHALGELIERRTLRLADRVVVVSDRLKEFVTGMGASPGKMNVIRPGISLEQFNPAVSGEAIRKQLGIGKEDIVLFFMGWLYHFAGLKEIALELARRKRENVKLVIAGEGDAYEDLLRIQGEYNLQDRLIMVGQRPHEDMSALIAAADVCLLAADPREKLMRDGLPQKIFEYLAMGKPMIATRLPGVMKEFGEGNGVVYVDRPEDAVDKALELVNSGQAKKLGKKARKSVKRYDWDKIVDRFEEILEEVIKEKSMTVGK
ncbi:MAG: glycosyltransferase family 4 protein [Chloroflexi bacterium]|nr:glycosyltransferase family 4 protein [Chloroflexota bacterium]